MQALDMETIIEEMALENHLDPEAFAAFLEYESLEIDEAVEAFQDCYAGTFDNLEAFAEDYGDNTGLLDHMPENLRYYFDYSAFGRDMDLCGDIWTADVPGGIAVFWTR